jgi:hypothetical protein
MYMFVVMLVYGRNVCNRNQNREQEKKRMTRKDFVLIAATIKALAISPEDRVQVADDFASALRNTNPNFKRERFLTACGVANV